MCIRDRCQSFVALESPIVKSLMLVVGDPAGGGNSRITIGVSTEGARKAPYLLSPSPQLTTRTYADLTSTLQTRLSQAIAQRCGGTAESVVWPSLVCHPLLPLNIAKLQYAEDQQSMPPTVITIRLRPLADVNPQPLHHQSLCFMNPIQQEAARLRQFVLPGSTMTTIKSAYSCYSALILVPVVSTDVASGAASDMATRNESQRSAEVMVGRPYIDHGHPTAALGIPIQPHTLPSYSPLTERQHANPQRHPSSMMLLNRAPSNSAITRKASNLRRVASMERSNAAAAAAGDPALNNYTTIANFEMGSEEDGEDSISEAGGGSTPMAASASPSGMPSVLPPPAASSRPPSSTTTTTPSSMSVQAPSRLYKLIHVTLKGYGDALQSSTSESEEENDQLRTSSEVVLENSLGFLSHATQSAQQDPKFTSIECPFVEDENVVGLVELFFGSSSSSTSTTTPWSPLHLPVSGVRAHFNGGSHCDLLSYFMSLWAVSNQNGLPTQDAAVRINIAMPQHRPTQRDLVIYNAPSIIQTPALVGGSSSVGWRVVVAGGKTTLTSSSLPATTSPLQYPMSVSYTHLRAHETPEHLVCRLLLEKKKKKIE
eukprot:TRINITY_DN11462_c0_g1_i3.p1 TRINITY_DN11462_c0_g1~~TRINITY_DN11462_c0_g1_i3.p1  ORF type:complete len:599 (-),score=98.92 TRINITY_DN11462_c0_g1_i3:69-1865(-)